MDTMDGLKTDSIVLVSCWVIARLAATYYEISQPECDREYACSIKVAYPSDLSLPTPRITDQTSLSASPSIH